MKVGVFAPFFEEKNINEFIKYYEYLGFDYFIFLDDSKNKNNMISENIINKKNVSVIINPKEKREFLIRSEKLTRLVLNEALNKNIDYLLNIDMDEYLYLKNKNIKYLINNYKNYDIIEFKWLLFGNTLIYEFDNSTLLNKLMEYKCELINQKIIFKINNKIASNIKIIEAHDIFFKNKEKKKKITIPNRKILNEIKLKKIHLKDVEVFLCHFVNQGTKQSIFRRFDPKFINNNRLKRKVKNDKFFDVKLYEESFEKIKINLENFLKKKENSLEKIFIEISEFISGLNYKNKLDILDIYTFLFQNINDFLFIFDDDLCSYNFFMDFIEKNNDLYKNNEDNIILCNNNSNIKFSNEILLNTLKKVFNIPCSFNFNKYKRKDPALTNFISGHHNDMSLPIIKYLK